ncbi:hypothetical protein [Roseospira navarrensis]|uniref:Uncharacterized protein n=1 Tax=Roseospira navarrensis TaxID=140058 RepID=A0A7X1ZCF2_9PROT|nr:hypothetical protein [Roseospira navarrensis]MQX35998.1 hypothetical protein [Roseospira navarrensis]
MSQQPVKVETQGISADWTRADGSYDAVHRGLMDHAGLVGLFQRIHALEVPEEDRFNDFCPPHVMASGPAGSVSFVMDGGAIFCDETECEVTPAEAAALATGRESITDVARRHAGESGTAFVQGPDRARAEAEGRRPAPPRPPIGLARKLLGYTVAGGFLLVGLGTLGAGLEAGTGDDLYAALFMGGLLVVVGLLIAWAVRKAATHGRARPAGQTRGGGWSGTRRHDDRDDDWDRDRDRRDDRGGDNDTDSGSGGDDGGGGDD